MAVSSVQSVDRLAVRRLDRDLAGIIRGRPVVGLVERAVFEDVPDRAIEPVPLRVDEVPAAWPVGKVLDRTTVIPLDRVDAIASDQIDTR